MDEVKVSVIVPVYNTEQYLHRCVESLLKQTMPVRIILVDDGSTDGSGAICDRYAASNDNITVIHKQNGGLSSARNTGVEYAETELIAFADSDDWVTEDMYGYLYGLQKQYKADVVQIEYVTAPEGKEVVISPREEHVLCLDNREEILRQYLQDGMKPAKSYSACTKLYKNELLKCFPFPEGRAYEDIVVNYDILIAANKYIVSNKQCYYYFIRSQSITKGIFNKKDFDYIKAGEQIAERTKDIPGLKALGSMTLARFHFSCVSKMIKFGCEPGIDWEKQVRISVPIIRSGKKEMLKSGMKKELKILMVLMCINTRLTTFLVRIRNKRTGE